MPKKLIIEDMQAIAKERGGECLSATYVNAYTKLDWQCAKGHRWKAVPHDVKNHGSWCPDCGAVARQVKQRISSIEDMRAIAQKRGGKCLSYTYVNNRTKLEWQCREGHIWMATPGAVKNQGSWCHKCGIELSANKRRLCIEEAQAIAQERGGKCLSGTYINTNTKLEWQCQEGHKWMNSLGHIKSGQWCPVCGGSVKSTIENMQPIAQGKGGKCLSDVYENNHTRLEWQCREGHKWMATPNAIQSGQWCPECATGFGERIARLYFETLLGSDFPKCRPQWLVNDAGYRMELDGYCKSLDLAFEHQGQHHYGKKFGMTNEAFEKRQKDDAKKVRLCSQRGIILVRVPEVGTLLSVDDLEDFIRNELKSLNFDKCKLPKKPAKVELSKAYIDLHRAALDEVKSLAEERGGRCLSDTYINSKTNLKWQCSSGHTWTATSDAVKNKGTWCPKCAGTSKLAIEDMHKLAISRGGKCLSKSYVNNRTKLKWQCAKRHTWMAAPKIAKKGHWCPECGGTKKRTIEDMRTMAKQRGGKCLSNTYINADAKLEWQCSKGHVWMATPYHVTKRGQWCSECGRTKKLTIEKMQELAKERGGKCISDIYVNSRTRLEWQCNEGHTWMATPNDVKNNGSWCPVCGGKIKS